MHAIPIYNLYVTKAVILKVTKVRLNTSCSNSPTFGTQLKRRRESHLEVCLEGDSDLRSIHQYLSLKFSFKPSVEFIDLIRISPHSECAPRWHKRRQFNHHGLFGVPAPDALVLEDERMLDRGMEVFT